MAASISTSNVTAGFIDLATYDELEKYMYGGSDATAYFVRETRKATWFTQVPVVLSRASGQPDFNQEWSATISRAGDYLLQTWLRVTLPEVTIKAGNPDIRLRWTKNLMHNLVKECAITFNDLVAARFDNYHLDFWSAFTVPSGKRNGYNNMIGNFDELVAPQTTLSSYTLNLPLPLFYSRDSGVALPTAALPYNDMRLQFSFRNWTELLIADDNSVAPVVSGDASAYVNSTPVLGRTEVWANYAIVSNDERKRMACAPRDILIEQVQTAPRHTFAPLTNEQPSFDIRLSHAIKVLFFGVRNTSVASQWSNYTAGSPVPTPDTLDSVPVGAVDPVASTSLVYENTARLSAMGSDYFSLVQPFYGAPVVPLETGYHMYSYSLDFVSLDPMGSTNFGKLTNVSVMPVASEGAKTAAAGGGADDSGYAVAQTFEFILTCVNNNVVRISGGALGFPVL